MSIANQIPDLEGFARDFMKHQKSTSLKHYIVEGVAANKVIEYSLGITKLYQIDGLNDEEESETKQLIEKMKKVFSL